MDPSKKQKWKNFRSQDKCKSRWRRKNHKWYIEDGEAYPIDKIKGFEDSWSEEKTKAKTRREMAYNYMTHYLLKCVGMPADIVYSGFRKKVNWKDYSTMRHDWEYLTSHEAHWFHKKFKIEDGILKRNTEERTRRYSSVDTDSDFDPLRFYEGRMSSIQSLQPSDENE